MAWVGAALAGAQIGSSILGGKAANKAAKKAAKAQVKALTLQRDEERRLRIKDQARTRGAARAEIGASNIQFSGSAEKYINALDMENMRELAYQKKAQEAEAKAVMSGASGVGTPLYAKAAGDLIGFAARTYAASRVPSASVSTGSYGFGGGPSANPGYVNPNVGAGPLAPAPVQTNVPYPTGVN